MRPGDGGAAGGRPGSGRRPRPGPFSPSPPRRLQQLCFLLHRSFPADLSDGLHGHADGARSSKSGRKLRCERIICAINSILRNPLVLVVSTRHDGPGHVVANRCPAVGAQGNCEGVNHTHLDAKAMGR
ncbi:hypothetical protein EVAR_95215_1 [Eumeta japonica]|uniref:Uncharacterized protein n=1 Tax=Eumeta variegata TaxID=151549 RepID=A0A4C1VIH2_EUMVA|nr:hypothetical protein EVAR_95215_1 [Eumeta japonica]